MKGKAEIGDSGSYTDYFVMIIHDFFLSVKQLRFDTYYFCLMLVLVIPQIETSVFFFNLRLYIIPDVTRIICNKLCFLRSQEIQDLLGQCFGRSWSCSGHW